jgi:hypothetical protein
VSFESREKKRRYKAAKVKAGSNRTDDTRKRWFLTVAKPGRYECCGGGFERGAEIVFRYEPRTIRCVRCAERLEDSKGFRPSLRWEKARRLPAPIRP